VGSRAAGQGRRAAAEQRAGAARCGAAPCAAAARCTVAAAAATAAAAGSRRRRRCCRRCSRRRRRRLLPCAHRRHLPPRLPFRAPRRTCALGPNSFWKMPKVPGPHTSCVISLSTLVQMLSPGATDALSLWLARIFSVMVMARLTCAAEVEGGGAGRGGLRRGAGARARASRRTAAGGGGGSGCAGLRGCWAARVRVPEAAAAAPARGWGAGARCGAARWCTKPGRELAGPGGQPAASLGARAGARAPVQRLQGAPRRCAPAPRPQRAR
jgi:hypothetical protein